MPKSRPAKTVESFGPEIFEALIEGSKRVVEVPLPYAKAVGFRQRANSLRNAMREAGHEKYKIVSQTSLRIVWGAAAGYAEVPEKRNTQNVRFPVDRAAPAKLIISPADAEFGEALRAAGVTIKPLGSTTDPLDKSELASPVKDDILEQFLKEPSDATDE